MRESLEHIHLLVYHFLVVLDIFLWNNFDGNFLACGDLDGLFDTAKSARACTKKKKKSTGNVSCEKKGRMRMANLVLWYCLVCMQCMENKCLQPRLAYRVLCPRCSPSFVHRWAAVQHHRGPEYRERLWDQTLTWWKKRGMSWKARRGKRRMSVGLWGRGVTQIRGDDSLGSKPPGKATTALPQRLCWVGPGSRLDLLIILRNFFIFSSRERKCA